MENTGFQIEFRIFHLHKIFYSANLGEILDHPPFTKVNL